MDEKLDTCCSSFMYTSFSFICSLLQTISLHTTTEMSFLKLISKITLIQKHNLDMPEVAVSQM